MATDKPVPELDESPADTALEMARLRRRVAELESSQSAAPPITFTANTEISAGVDEDGNERWWYKVDLPPSGGVEVKINGIAFYHGEQYNVGTDTLRSLKDIVFRCWKHEGDIHGNNENFYRRPTERVLRGAR